MAHAMVHATANMAMKPRFFTSAADFRQWLTEHHATEKELLVGFYKKHTRCPSIDWPQSVDQALCFGWIDGVRRRIDDDSYCIRFTPRKPKSNWSDVNLRRVAELVKLQQMQPAGLAAFENRDLTKVQQYSFEQQSVSLPPEMETAFRGHSNAWEFFQSQAPSYCKAACWWVASAKQEATRAKRFALLIDDSAHGRRLKHLTRPKKHA